MAQYDPVGAMKAVPVFTINPATGIATPAPGVPASSQLTRAAVNIAAADTSELVAGVSSQIIRVYRVFLLVAGANALTFQSAAASLHGGAFSFPGGGSLTWDFSTEPWLTTVVAEALNLVTTTSAQVSGFVDYLQG